MSLLVTTLLEALSSLEDARINYIEQHAARAGIDPDRLESARCSSPRLFDCSVHSVT
jgi:proteasome component ECM29